ncbi:BON domain-containing protein [Phenylobacterium sp. J426]|uniref:BON domain-containing protein n=1 Tax=Phenylobacterium sp. J426 TaxID=2898439 RepID=UPI0021513356|nr:BON domain-containing protein [Phenylobacterium sp. J426]MCR5875585.1 BON domain-containing protein [Phenylobacterium sp. J426]
MAREDWRDEHHERDRAWRAEPRDRDDFGQADYSTDFAYDSRTRTGYRADETIRARRDDYGQADYTTDWAYDPERGRPYRRFSSEDRSYEPREPSRSWKDRASEFFGGRSRDEDERRFDDARRLDDGRGYDAERRYDEERRSRRRRGSSDRVLWAVIMERLEDDRRIDMRDVDVIVEDGEVTLNGTVRRKEDKRRIEDVADIDGVRNVQNNLRLRDRDRGWTFL